MGYEVHINPGLYDGSYVQARILRVAIADSFRNRMGSVGPATNDLTTAAEGRRQQLRVHRVFRDFK